MNRDVELIKKRLLSIPEVAEVKVKEKPSPNLDAYLQIVLKKRDYEVTQKVADAISDVQCTLWDQKKDFPSVEWRYSFQERI